MKKVYLAGFDVFRADAHSHGRALQRLCGDYGLQGCYPLDAALPEGLHGAVAARWIYQANVATLQACDAVLANLGAFRGLEPDSGTVFEMGMAVALGKPVWAYFAEAGDLLAQVPHDTDGRDAQGYQVEAFGLPRNLMLACSWRGHSPTVEEAVAKLSAILLP